MLGGWGRARPRRVRMPAGPDELLVARRERRQRWRSAGPRSVRCRCGRRRRRPAAGCCWHRGGRLPGATRADPLRAAGGARDGVPVITGLTGGGARMGMSKAEEEEQARLERARAAGLFRYMLIREAADPALSSRQRGKMVREIAAREHAGPSGRPVRVTRWTLDVWIRRWRQGGFDALVPSPRQCQPRTPPEVMELAVALKKENRSEERRVGKECGGRGGGARARDEMDGGSYRRRCGT